MQLQILESQECSTQQLKNAIKAQVSVATEYIKKKLSNPDQQIDETLVNQNKKVSGESEEFNNNLNLLYL